MPRDQIATLQIPRSSLPRELFDELKVSIRGPVFKPSDAEFTERSKGFNGKLVCQSKLLACPLDVQDVSAIVKFCSKHGLSPSVKAGGYGIAGWAVAGDVIIDLAMLRECDIEPPLPDAEEGNDWIRMRDMSPPGSKGKGRATSSNDNPEITGMKRRREDSPEPVEEDLPKLKATQEKRNLLRSYDGASKAVATFLNGAPLPPEEGEEPRQPPANRRRVYSPEPSTSQQHHASVQQAESTQQPEQRESDDLQPDVCGVRTQPETADPFEYMLPNGSSQPPPLTLTSTNPFGATPASLFALRTFSNMGTWTPPPSSSMGAQGAWGAGAGPSMLSPFVAPGPYSARMDMSSFVMSSEMLPPHGQLVGMAPAQPVHKHAYVTLGAGMRQKEVDMYTAEHPLEGFSAVTGLRENGVVPYHMPSSAHPVGSSILLLGGFGFISRMYGLSIDNVVEIEMVLADGRIVIVNKDDEPELWWAIRGAGPAFGIATRYKVRAFPVPVVFAGNLIYRFHRSTAASLIKHFRDCIKGAPRELYVNVLLTAGPADKDSLLVIQMCYAGPKEQGMEYLNAISSWDGERCILNEVNEKSYLSQQDSVAQILRGKAGRQWFMRSALIHSLPDEVINKTVIQFANTPIGCTWLFELSGGAIADFEDTCLPKEQREATWTVAALHQWEMGIDDPRCIASAEELVDRGHGQFLARHEPPSRTQTCYGKNWARLAELKRKYDPNCLFKNNLWPVDKDGNPIELLSNEPPSP
ncbi:uncharacterized protein LAESUDRAFT_739160 [Laetiporus sulphureus 93-53]|uniref:FAD-binding PCMH-type domain-containing protein n=1 Tax=Laetiporus sulphureus 93-53 TaxID=1314785 RepID=A0A165BQW0_9APHY|nr:uncharacterized protein LAESUDRAFT_739160 [Laetiporus sulphureus 93-53]KZT01489.1 hypothetical protein LAESUDRAFT_739160 [Laetiporus sulphureus 93-53]